MREGEKRVALSEQGRGERVLKEKQWQPLSPLFYGERQKIDTYSVQSPLHYGERQEIDTYSVQSPLPYGERVRVRGNLR